jgi:hypothetical protein
VNEVREFFIRSLESIVNILIVLGAIIVVVGAIGVGLDVGRSVEGGGAIVGTLTFVAVLLGGFVYLTLLGGFIYLALGIYSNTKRTAEAVERLQSRN